LEILKKDPIGALKLPGAALTLSSESLGRPFDRRTQNPVSLRREYRYQGDARAAAQAVLAQALAAGWKPSASCNVPGAYFVRGAKRFGRWTARLEAQIEGPQFARGQLVLFTVEAPYPGEEPKHPATGDGGAECLA
jgi:hypothetical protein